MPTLLSKDRGTVLTGVALLAVTLLAWAGLIAQSRLAGPDTEHMASAMIEGLSPAAAAAFVAAWLVMMAAMMLPSAAPMVMLYRSAVRGHHAPRIPVVHTSIFVAGYLVVWGAFGLLVYLAQAGVTLAARSSESLAGLAPLGTAGVLVLAGLYELTPLKSVCLRQCRSPLDFLIQRWRNGLIGAFRLGMDHGLYCLGCCWGLMAVLVAAGSMGLAWVALIALVVFVEKLLPRGDTAARLAGLLLIGLGVAAAVYPEFVDVLAGKPIGGR